MKENESPKLLKVLYRIAGIFCIVILPFIITIKIVNHYLLNMEWGAIIWLGSMITIFYIFVEIDKYKIIKK